MEGGKDGKKDGKKGGKKDGRKEGRKEKKEKKETKRNGRKGRNGRNGRCTLQVEMYVILKNVCVYTWACECVRGITRIGPGGGLDLGIHG